MKILWLTDIHLNFLNPDDRQQYYETLVETKPEAILISGDIAEGDNVVSILQEMYEAINVPIYFVLGNHDYWYSSVDKILDILPHPWRNKELLTYVPDLAALKLTEKTWLVGVDGWADGRYGDYANSSVRLYDSTFIEELNTASFIGSRELLSKMQELADKDAKSLKRQLEEAILLCPKKIIILTHIPPFEEACVYNGKVSHPHYLPFFSCKATGDVILEIALSNSGIEFLVLCGHTHGECRYDKLDNLKVWVGGAEYGKPEFVEIEI